MRHCVFALVGLLALIEGEVLCHLHNGLLVLYVSSGVTQYVPRVTDWALAIGGSNELVGEPVFHIIQLLPWLTYFFWIRIAPERGHISAIALIGLITVNFITFILIAAFLLFGLKSLLMGFIPHAKTTSLHGICLETVAGLLVILSATTFFYHPSPEKKTKDKPD